MKGVTRVTWMTKMSGTTELAWKTKMNSMTGISWMGRMTSSSVKKPEKDLMLCGILKIVCTSGKILSKNVVVLYQLRKVKTRKKLIPKMPEISNGEP